MRPENLHFLPAPGWRWRCMSVDHIAGLAELSCERLMWKFCLPWAFWPLVLSTPLFPPSSPKIKTVLERSTIHHEQGVSNSFKMCILRTMKHRERMKSKREGTRERQQLLKMKVIQQETNMIGYLQETYLQRRCLQGRCLPPLPQARGWDTDSAILELTEFLGAQRAFIECLLAWVYCQVLSLYIYTFSLNAHDHLLK